MCVQKREGVTEYSPDPDPTVQYPPGINVTQCVNRDDRFRNKTKRFKKSPAHRGLCLRAPDGSQPLTFSPMAQKVKWYLRITEFDERKEEFITNYDKSTTYDLDNKDDVKALTKRSMKLLVGGAELRLYQTTDRDALRESFDPFAE